jgi:DNA-binding transcriptional ArsR family regulator
MTRKDLIQDLFALGLERETVIEHTKKAFPKDDLYNIENQVGVCLYELRQMGIVPSREKGTRPSRHTITVRGLKRDKTNRQILKHLKKVYPEMDEKIHKQRICEYRWFFNKGLIH